MTEIKANVVLQFVAKASAVQTTNPCNWHTVPSRFCWTCPRPSPAAVLPFIKPTRPVRPRPLGRATVRGSR